MSRPRQRQQASRRNAFTLIEMFLVIAVVGVLLVLWLAALRRVRPLSSRASCTNNLKQVGLGFRTWSTDNSNLFPMRVYTNEAGAMMFTDAANLFRNFLVMSNELNNPKVVLCPQDMQRTNAYAFDATFSGSNVSYFVGLDADETNSASILSGDRNITNGTALRNGILEVFTNQSSGWTTSEQHRGAGNILLSDGSVQQVSMNGLRGIIANTGLATNRLGMP